MNEIFFGYISISKKLKANPVLAGENNHKGFLDVRVFSDAGGFCRALPLTIRQHSLSFRIAPTY